MKCKVVTYCSVVHMADLILNMFLSYPGFTCPLCVRKNYWRAVLRSVHPLAGWQNFICSLPIVRQIADGNWQKLTSGMLVQTMQQNLYCVHSKTKIEIINKCIMLHVHCIFVHAQLLFIL